MMRRRRPASFGRSGTRPGGGLQTAEQFVEQECTRSSTTGQAYKVRFKDGSEKPARDFLLDELRQVKG